MTTDRDATLEAIRVRGWAVVLLRRRAKKPAGVVPPGALPGTKPTWDVTTDVDRVARHLRGGGNLGLLTGPANQVAVLDPDQLVPWADMIEAIGQPAAAWTLTGRGRLHYFIQWAPNLPAKLEWFDVTIGEIQRGPRHPTRAALQQIVIPPSIHPDAGRPYEWLVDPVTQPLEPLPPEWRARLHASAR